MNEFKYGNHSKTYSSAVIDYEKEKIIALEMGKFNNNHLVAEIFKQIEEQIIS